MRRTSRERARARPSLRVEPEASHDVLRFGGRVAGRRVAGAVRRELREVHSRGGGSWVYTAGVAHRLRRAGVGVFCWDGYFGTLLSAVLWV